MKRPFQFLLCARCWSHWFTWKISIQSPNTTVVVDDIIPMLEIRKWRCEGVKPYEEHPQSKGSTV